MGNKTEYTRLSVTLCQELVSIPSLSGDEGDVAKALSAAMHANGFDRVDVDRYGNVVGRILGNRPGPCILLDGHMDTVPVPDPSVWSQDPFGGDVVGNKIYGRGTSDMKGALAAMVGAAAWFADEKGRDFAGQVCVAGVVHEEMFEGIAAREISAAIKPDFVVIGEASELNLKIGQRGRAEIVVETFGVPAHSANPEKGVNAVHKMNDLTRAIETIEAPEQDVLGKGICVLTDIKSTPYPGASVVPSGCRVTYDRRLLVGETPESVLAPINEMIGKLSESDPDFKAKAYFAKGKESCYTGKDIAGERFFPGWLYGEDEPFVSGVLDGLKQAGLTPEISHYAFCTNGSHYAGEAGIRTLGYGPSRENLAHTIDEHVEIEQLEKATLGYKAIIEALLKTD
ncbi:YgeY family selenium metabolism-linked hydrolase [Pseudodesulfovibrio cashew]|uniref:YgeY family selenium metabolism-linked hydrolase n=1 Tax=Pseudodesulfovibrio cashew TaxID=2678688 RepID=A0A6I6JBZ8_9BACT|nr:YgeY family selenium metabolism-linked hydrolase [Pseudodesulfovibrio cashew]QGY38678.1 YgeY family selenium metabolism-linked hydrolase [Pseudodesulfovibrio cashew]